MERVTFRNSRNLTLVGNFHSASSHSAIVLAHGFTSDKSSDGRFERLGKSLHSTGYNVLAFDFGGCGESDDDILSIDHQLDDLKSAISFVQSEGAVALGLHGHSLGSLICLKSYSSKIATMVLTGALTDSMHYDQKSLLQNVTCPVLFIHGTDRGDSEEQQLLERSRRGVKFLSPDSRLEVIEGANHGLRNHYEKVVTLAVSWYKAHLPLV